MEPKRRNFLLALTLFVGWIIALGVMAFTSGDPPRPRAAAHPLPR